ncbi:MAG: hypothetical protein DRH90_12505 [Deltaproteobacteria bacterium]|nr:MAG: hypothetical protein DRH90_12505 [Deltaproteobacteria bacterium]
MNWLKDLRFLTVVLVVLIAMGVFIGVVRADETVITRGVTDKGYVRLKSTTNTDGVTTTKGTINGKYVRTKTSNGVTRGTVGGKYVRLKSKTTTDDFKPDWDPDW